ncbi:MAG: Nramp family divalent metal transporter [Pirellulaceae bacterium]|jgi:manganese transport protein
MSSEPALDSPSSKRKWHQAIGPGLITACVVIGPGSILSSSKVGATQGYNMLWLIVIACLFMAVFMTLGAKLGVVLDRSLGEVITELAGKKLAIAIGLGVFVISTAYQSGNNLGVQSAFKALGASHGFSIVLVIAFNALSISFLYVFKNLYKALERVMMCFVGLMLICFTVNLAIVQPNLGDLFKGFVPQTGAFGDISVLALVGTTFVISAAYFQAYLAQQKGWNQDELRSGLIDARVGTVIMCLITIMLICTAAAGLAGKELTGVEDVAAGLEPTFGKGARLLFCLGLFSAAYSSFLVNSMIAGFIMSDGLGWGSKPTDNGPKHLTSFVLLTGMTVALLVISLFEGKNPVQLIIVAQAITVIFAPLLGLVLLWLTNSKRVMGEQTNGLGTNIIAGAGLLLLLAMSFYIVTVKLPKLLSPPAAAEATENPGAPGETSEPSETGKSHETKS